MKNNEEDRPMGDVEALGRLRAVVEVGWCTKTTYYSMTYGSNGTAVITGLSEKLEHYDRPGYTERLDKPIRNQGRLFTTGTGLWPQDGDDYEVQERDRYDRPVWILHHYKTEYGSRVRHHSVEFMPGTKSDGEK